MLTVLLLLMGLVVGVFSGLLGVGGGLLIIPAMLYIYPLFAAPALGIKLATGIAGVQSMAGGLSAALTHRRQGNLDLRLILVLGATTMLGAYLGSRMTDLFADIVLKLVYVILLCLTLAISAFYRKKPENLSDASSLRPRSNPMTIPMGLIIGYFSGLLGIGGAIMLIPLMHNLLHVPMRLAIGSSAGVVFITSIATVIGKAQGNLLPMPHSLLIAGGALAGGVIGARWAKHLSERFLKGLFLTIVGLTLVRLLVEVLAYRW